MRRRGIYVFVLGFVYEGKVSESLFLHTEAREFLHEIRKNSVYASN